MVLLNEVATYVERFGVQACRQWLQQHGGVGETVKQGDVTTQKTKSSTLEELKAEHEEDWKLLLEWHGHDALKSSIEEAHEHLVMSSKIIPKDYADEEASSDCKQFPKDYKIRLDKRTPEDRMLNQLELIKRLQYQGRLEGMIIASPLSVNVVTAIKTFLEDALDQRQRQTEPSGKWGCLVLETADDNVGSLLESLAIPNLFEAISLEVRREAPSELYLERLQKAFLTREIPILSVRRTHLTPATSQVLQTLLQNKCIQHLTLFRCQFTKQFESACHLADGLQEEPSNALFFINEPLMLKTLVLEHIENQTILFRVFAALQGHQSLQELHFVPCWTISENLLQLLEGLIRVLNHPHCRVVRLHTVWWCNTFFKSFWKAIHKNQSLVSIQLNGATTEADMGDLMSFVCRPHSRIVHVQADMRIKKDLLKYLPGHFVLGAPATKKKNVKDDITTRKAAPPRETQGELDTAVKSDPPPTRRLQFDLVHVDRNADALLELITKHLPYLYDMKRVGPECVKQRNYQLAMGKPDNVMTAEKLAYLALRLEENQVGCALLEHNRKPSRRLPLGLWSHVLSKAANQPSVVFEEYDKECELESPRPPLDGIHTMVHGLLPYIC